MSPLHILTCSSVHHDLNLYRMLIETHPEQLITKDKWGALPLLYAIWGAVPTEVIQLLLESYPQYFSDYKFKWSCMVETDDLLDRLAQILSSDDHLGRFGEMFRYLVMCSTSERVKAIGLSQWRDGITNVIATQTIDYRRLELYLIKIRSQLAHLEQEYFALKTSTTLLELALWKNKLNDEDGCQEETTMTKLNKSSDFR